MAAYVVVDAEVLDPTRLQEYRDLAEASIAQYGGRYLIQGTVPEVVEGTWPSSSRVMTVLEFATMERAREWYASTEYGRAKSAREGAIDVRLLLVEGKSE
ncbi:DUF1330 domain-containing protein [Streptoalloteichus hindustanus]|uniref:Uncharacterized conserved protein, DUF1330 family n=1 Tax=Streptoalloteichus hindustanus TaxID=2017 RepID=A0A1M5FR96_STRHI|nr:DUF1330 domain-containing protein [Streptoalloteichus hindustanus]SHF94097.1 Uncharacterized conserved protein, DUF1330 family [Streptoalloteichus hindustanus]